ncbi:hypothetical protein N7456_006740 [Penicillium angulare]|uniref:RNAse P, Rpr2/Rpp21 subunit n=1 Tax=Penicillium angulare TaxID=116970 RepID=A0A9W9FI72_9EURO|nr:hypothetical protein N7456_006740 [Penicillium angulare]
MVKAKAPKEGKNSKSHLKARLEYLDQAARYLHQSTSTTTEEQNTNSLNGGDKSTNNGNESLLKVAAQPKDTRPLMNLSRVFASHMRGVSLKTLTRLPIPVKRSFCKSCDTLLVPGVTCHQEIRNLSKGGKKPWADVLEIQCTGCGCVRRFPQTDKRSKKLVARRKEAESKDQQLAPASDET